MDFYHILYWDAFLSRWAGEKCFSSDSAWTFTIYTDDKGKFDELVEDKGVKILIDPKALMHVIGTKMDFVDDKLRYPAALKSL